MQSKTLPGPFEQPNYLLVFLKIILNIFIVLLIVFVLLIGAYFLYQNIPGEPKSINMISEPLKLEVGNLSYEVKQFHPNMKFNHNSISYNIDSGCDNDKKKRMLEAFSELKENVKVINFHSVSERADIEVSCSEYTYQKEKDFFIAGEGGAKEIIQTGKYNVITNGVILLHGNPHGFYKCEWPNIELHELLHVFGFDHSKDEYSLMYPYLESCDQKLDKSIVNDLKKLYSKENLADLYFEEVTAVKKGRYLDFNISIKNLGVVSAENTMLDVFDDDKKVGNFELKNISFGAGVNFYVVNFKLKSRSSKNIKLVIDADNLIKEIDENNNAAELKFG